MAPTKRSYQKKKVFREPAKGAKTAVWIPYGYLYDKKTLVAVDDEVADAVRFIFREYLSGTSIRQIAKLLNEQGVPAPYTRRMQLGETPRGYNKMDSWVGSTMNLMLFNPMYAGDLLIRGRVWDCCYYYAGADIPEDSPPLEIKTGHHEALISREDMRLASERYLADRETRHQQKAGYQKYIKEQAEVIPNEVAPLSGPRYKRSFYYLLRCGCCGGMMHHYRAFDENGDGHSEYICLSFQKKAASTCVNHTYKQEDIAASMDAAVLAERKEAVKMLQYLSAPEKPVQFCRVENHLVRQLRKAVDAARKEAASSDLSADELSDAEQHVMEVLDRLRLFRKAVSPKNPWLALFSSQPEKMGLLNDPERMKLLVKEIRLYPDKEPEVILAKAEEKQQLMDMLYMRIRHRRKAAGNDADTAVTVSTAEMEG